MKLSQNLVRLRRQSDILGKTAPNEFCLLLQRPVYDNEPVEAANRFAASLKQQTDMITSGSVKAMVRISLIDLPTGSLMQVKDVGGGAE